MQPRRCCALILVAVTVGCASEPILVAPRPPTHYERLGTTTGEGCGALLLNLVPIEMNSRVERAYADALRRTPGATALLSVDLTENWYWFVIGVSHCVMLEGIAIREITSPSGSSEPQSPPP